MANTEKRRKPRDCHVTLEADLVIGGAAELHARLGKALSDPAAVVLDAAAVARLDTCGLQLLLAFVQARNAGGHPWRWENVGGGLRDAAALLGMQGMLELPDAIPAHD